jgi:diadenosine tetraphosphate (Ap4A) HIT family hydrolase
MNPQADWSLDPRLAGDTIAAGDLPLCRVLAMNDANYPWLILVPRRPGLVEIIDLRASDQAMLMREIDLAARALKTLTHCDKLNVAALGNSVPQLHVHVIARFKADAAGARPVWSAVPAKPYEAAALAAFVTQVRGALGLVPSP